MIGTFLCRDLTYRTQPFMVILLKYLMEARVQLHATHGMLRSDQRDGLGRSTLKAGSPALQSSRRRIYY